MNRRRRHRMSINQIDP